MYIWARSCTQLYHSYIALYHQLHCNALGFEAGKKTTHSCTEARFGYKAAAKQYIHEHAATHIAELYHSYRQIYTKATYSAIKLYQSNTWIYGHAAMQIVFKPGFISSQTFQDKNEPKQITSNINADLTSTPKEQ